MTTKSTTGGPQCLFVTLGMLILDELHFSTQDTRFDVIGGSGAYSSLGARIYSPPPLSHQVGWLIHTGDDFPHIVKEHLQSWDVLLLKTRMAGCLSTRGKLVYQDTTFGPKTFQYTTKPLKIEPKHLLNTPLLSSRSFHLLTSPDDTIIQVKELLDLRSSSGIQEPPILVWEPFPPLCIAQNLDACLRAAELVDVFSPNHIELGRFFSVDLSRDEQFDRATIEGLCQTFLAHGIGPARSGTIVIRAGHEGCCVYSRKKKEFAWLAPFHSDTSKVADPTGAGNAFLGGFTIGLLETGDDLIAACYGTVASAFALEQIGLPIHESTMSVAGKMVEVDELWNKASVRERLREYISRVGISH